MGDEFKDVEVGKPIITVTGGKAFGPEGQRYWWPEENAEPTEEVLGDDWTEVGFTTDEPIALSLTAADINPTIRAALFGGDVVSEIRSPLSIIIETTDIVSGAPSYPTLPVLDQPWYLFHTRRRVVRERARLINLWEQRYALWVADGRPDREVLVRRYIPSAQVVLGD